MYTQCENCKSNDHAGGCTACFKYEAPKDCPDYEYLIPNRYTDE